MIQQFALAYNESTDTYELHAAGCAHLNLNKFQGVWEYEAANVTVAKTYFEFGDGPKIHKISPCTKGAA